MSITRIFQEGFEINDWDSFAPWIAVGVRPTYFTSVKYTGNNSSKFTGTALAMYIREDTPIAQMRAGLMFLVSGATNTPGLFVLSSGTIDNPVLMIYYNASTNTWYAYAGATELGNFVLDVEDSTWRHFGIDFKADASAGWCYIYIDGVAALSYSGKTDYGDSDFDLIGIGGINATYDNWATVYIDDFYVDNSTGEGAAAPLTLKRFYPLSLNGTGNYSQWHGDDGDQVSNYARIDVRTLLSSILFDGMIESQTSGHRDSWTLAATAGISGASTIPAVITWMWAQRRSVTDGVQITPFFRHSSTDDDGTPQTPIIGTGIMWERFTTDPSSAAWTVAVIDDLEMGIKFE